MRCDLPRVDAEGHEGDPRQDDEYLGASRGATEPRPPDGCSQDMRRAIVLAALAALALPTAASAKEVGALTLCGTDGCQRITARAALRGFMNGGYETLAPKQGAPFFSVKVAMRNAGEDAGGWT